MKVAEEFDGSLKKVDVQPAAMKPFDGAVIKFISLCRTMGHILAE